MDDPTDERFRQTVAALHSYCESPENPLTGPQFSRLVAEMFAARDALVEAMKTRRPPEGGVPSGGSPGRRPLS